MATHIPLFVCLFFFSIPSCIFSTLAYSDNYIIHMDLSAMPKVFSDHHNWYLATLDSVLNNSKLKTTTTTSFSSFSSKLIYSYTHVMNGFSASLSPSELEAMKNSPGYISSIQDLPVKADTTHSSQFLGLNSNLGAWPASNYGGDVIIGLVDTGVWPESESFNDNGMAEIPSRWKGKCESGTQFNSSLCNKKLIGAQFFNKGLIANNPNLTIALNSPRDGEGHGTHTSSTAAGNYVEGASYFGYAPGIARGVAPRARVAMYKALFDEGSITSDIIAAIDQAIIDGVDVISLSFGLDGVPLYKDPVAIATFGALEKGIFVSTSAGNEGPFVQTLHNGIPWVLTVAAGTVDREFNGIITLGNEASVTGLSLYLGNSSSKPIPIVFIDTCLKSEEFKNIGKKIVVCQDKNGSLSDQVDTVSDAKVVGGIFISNSSDLEFLTQSSFPAIFINPKDGEIVKDYIKSNSNSTPKASLEFGKTSLGTKPAPSVTSYSSRGPSQSCPFVLKPDLLAPGDQILAAWPENNSIGEVNKQPFYTQYNLLSGTSMSCPHAAGVAALLKGAHPEWSPAAIRSAMMTTSYTTDNTQSPIKDIGNDNKPASPLAIGAGHVDPNKALDPGLIYDAKFEDYVNLLCALNYSKTQIQIITKSASYNCSTPSLDLNYPSFIAFFNVNGSNSETKSIREFHRTVTNVGERQSTYVASVTPISELQVSVTPDKLVFKEKNEKQSYKLTIQGPRLLKEETVFGYLNWEDSEGKHMVRSPIVATSLSSDALSQS